MIDINDVLPRSIDAAADALECAVSGKPFDIEDVIAGGRALEILVMRAENSMLPVNSLRGLYVTIMDFAGTYPQSLPKTKSQEIVISGYVTRLRVIREFI